jgi:YgiT-type zinc finger domain-containing protein
MRGAICKTGDCFPGIANFTNIVKEKLVVVKNVKANICDNCREAYFDAETVNCIQIKTKEAIKNNEDVGIVYRLSLMKL